MTMASLIKEYPQGVSIFRINGKWHTEVRGSSGVKVSVSDNFPNEKELVTLLKSLEEYAYAS